MKSPILTDEIVKTLESCVRLYEDRRNGFGMSAETYRILRGRGWFKTERGWLGLTEKGYAEITTLLEAKV